MEVKLSKLVVNKFLHFHHTELNFDKYTSVNGKAQSADALRSFVEAIKFVFDCCRLQIGELEWVESDENAMEDDDATFVAAFISDPSANIHEFRKSIENGELAFAINGLEVAQDEYKHRMLATQIILPNINTLFIDTNVMEVLVGLTEKKRTELIESSHGSQELIDSYHKLVTQIGPAKLKIDFNRQKEADLRQEKRNVAKEVEMIEKRDETLKEYNEQVQEFALFRLFHNEKFLESAEGKIESEKENLEGFKGKVVDNFDDLKKKRTLDQSNRKMEEKLKVLTEERKNLQWNSEKQKSKIESLKKSEKLAEVLRGNIIIFEEKIASAVKKIAKLTVDGEINENRMKQNEKLEVLKKNFESDKAIVTLRHDIKTQKFLSNEEELSNVNNAIIRHNESLQKCREEFSEAMKDVEANKEKQIKIEQEITENLKHSQEFKELKENLTNLEAKIQRSKTEKILQQKFPTQILGQLSQLFTANSESDKNFIEKRLGKFSKAIVVENKNIANECIEFLKLKQLTDVNAIFLPLSEFSGQESTNVEIPRNFPARKIENLFACESKEVEKAMLHCLSPSVVCETMEFAEKAVKMPEFKKVNVMSIETATCFRKEGFIETAENVENTFESPEDIIEAESQRVAEKEKLKRLTIILEINEVNLVLLRRKHKDLEEKLKVLQKSAKSKYENFRFFTAKLEKSKESLNRIETDEERIESLKELKKLEDEIEAKGEEFFREFCESVEAQNIREFTENLNFSPETADKKIKVLNTKIEKFTEEVVINRELTGELSAMPSLIERETEILSGIIDKLNRKEAEIDELVELKIAKENEALEVKRKIHENQKINNEAIEKVFESCEKIYDDLRQIQESFSENFEIIFGNFIEQLPISLKTGTIKEFMMLGENLPDDHNLVKDQLKLISINCDHLKKSLKENIDDVGQKTQELLGKLKKLGADIDSASAFLPDNDGKRSLKQITEKLKAINKLLSMHETFVAKIQAKLDVVKNQRNKNIGESLTIVKKVIDDFYKLTFSGNFITNLELSSPDKPYSSGVVFTFQAVERPPQNVNETSENYTAALAFLFGLLKLKRQTLVILDNATQKVRGKVENFFEAQNNIQIINFTTLYRDETSKYAIRSKSQRFTVAKIHRDNE